MPKTEFEFSEWKPVFEQHIRRSRRAQTSWDRLVKAGCDPEVLAQAAAYACDFEGSPGNGHLFDETLEEWEQQRRRTERVTRQLEAVCKEAGELLEENNKLALAKASSDAAAELRHHVASIEELISCGDLNPTVFLVQMIDYVREHTGSPHYREVCDVLDVAYAAHGQEDIVTPGEEALRKAVDRFKRSHPGTVSTNNEHGIFAILMLAVIWIISQFSHKPEESDGGSAPSAKSDDISEKSILWGLGTPVVQSERDDPDAFASAVESVFSERNTE